MLPFRQVDVFSAEPLLGNPVAVVHDADALDDEQMAAFARWTNLSETTFLLAPTSPDADYRVRIWTPGGELPFAGHPTLGSAHAWLEAGGVPASPERVVQECPAGLVDVRRGERLAFAGPPFVRSGPVSPADLEHAVRVLGLAEADVVEAAWIDNGPGWMGLLVGSADVVLACRPDYGAFDDLKVGIVGPWPEGSECAVEVRAFCPGHGPEEDPVTGSLNAGIGAWLAGTRLPASYVAAQGTVLQRRGRVHVTREDDVVWVGGDTRTTVVGTVGLGD
ncbi:PhzF family phenazine biosynthesis protein [Nocardioides sp.]|uniref:PhzF family phenazine biosynthesis protein n=1 Tax=Nocardioides sp. TaxID=35761 RepID=UPI00271DE849|nr:PhzF family phenazine biosynthesis protein [Nocardioides sp.]MDO9456292.1 PhzF family phenazine biosynthesis protein [Nocardioides sp.]